MITLHDVYDATYDTSCRVLFDLLEERTPNQSISHRKMPSYEQHCAFVESRPYSAWYLIANEEEVAVGAVYLSKLDEIGIFIFERHQKKGYAKEAVEAIMEQHPRKRYLANIANTNPPSVLFFVELGFDLIQYTLAKEPLHGAKLH
jgi:GNAT superfamily N-acetyltransferase